MSLPSQKGSHHRTEKVEGPTKHHFSLELFFFATGGSKQRAK